MCIISIAVVLIYAISKSASENTNRTIIPWNWSRDFGQGVIWKFDHMIDVVETSRPLIIAHRGYSGAMPEETIEAYQMAVSAGADIIECDASLSKDLVVICVHDTWINKTTNVAEVFPDDRASEYFVPDETGGGSVMRDFFTVDFTIAELKNLTKVEPRSYRDQNNNGLYKIATLEEMIKIARSADRPVGIHVEIKDPILINNATKQLKNMDKKFEDLVVEVLNNYNYKSRRSPCFIQCFDENSLKYIANITSLPLVLLIGYPGNVSYARLKEISQFAYGIGPDKNHLVLVNSTTNLIISRSNMVEVAHQLGLRVHAYTFRNEHEFLAWNYRNDPYNELADFFKLGVDGYFTDFPDALQNFLEIIYSNRGSLGIRLSHSFCLLVSLLCLFVLVRD